MAITPRLILSDPNGNGADNSNQYLEDGSYLRLKTLTLGFNFPRNWLNTAAISNAKFYAGAQNLLTISKYQNITPISVGAAGGPGPGDEGNRLLELSFTRSLFVGLQFNL